MRLVRDTTRKDARLAGQPRAGRPRFERGFTIIELLIVIGIVMVLLSIIIVAVNAAMRSSQAANTQALMASINKGLVQFQSDIGYLPPVLDHERNYYPPPQPPENETDSNFAQYFQDVQEWHSITALAEYLLGYGDARDDGAGRVPPGEPLYELNLNDAPLGIRNPGPDGYWSKSMVDAAAGTLQDRRDFLESSAGARYRQGRVYGPYIELRDDRLLGAINPDNLYQNEQTGQYQIYFAGDALPAGQTWDDMPKVIVDYWGQPIRYFRKPYVTRNPAQDFRLGMSNSDGVRIQRTPTLSDVIVLRQWRIREEEAIDLHENAADQNNDPTASRALHAAAFGLLSAGPDRRWNHEVRLDEEEYNRDNIVELGR